MPSIAGRANIAPFDRQHELPAASGSHPQIIATDMDAVGEAPPLAESSRRSALFGGWVSSARVFGRSSAGGTTVTGFDPSAAVTHFSTSLPRPRPISWRDDRQNSGRPWSNAGCSSLSSEVEAAAELQGAGTAEVGDVAEGAAADGDGADGAGAYCAQ
jgi:hypothetical protein